MDEMEVVEPTVRQGEFFRVHHPDGRRGFVRADVVVPAASALGRIVAFENERLLATPGGLSRQTLTDGAELQVLGVHDRLLFVQTTNGIRGWVPNQGRFRPTNTPGNATRRAPRASLGARSANE
jgi:hypothetical protein